jgi:hypothetical protein
MRIGTPAPAVTPEMYKEVFEDHPTGRLVLAEMVRRFSQGAVVSGGIDAVLKTYQRIGQREVIDFIGNQIDMAMMPQQGEQEDV